MRDRKAISVALGMLDCPQCVPQARRAALPKGVTFLLEVAAGEPEAIAEAETLTGKSEGVLKRAAGFFIEQILMDKHGDNYRTLGAELGASGADLRRHMALLMRWLHPDLLSNGEPSAGLDRSVYASRVTKAWEAVKTEDRRLAYDASLAIGTGKAEPFGSGYGVKPPAGSSAERLGASLFDTPAQEKNSEGAIPLLDSVFSCYSEV